MKRGLLVLLLGITAALAAFTYTRHHCLCASSSCCPTAATDGSSLLPELAWLRRELDLDDAQFARVRELHLAHRPVCESLCHRIDGARLQVHQLVAQGELVASPALAAALQQQAAVEEDCRRAFYHHVHQTAALLSPDQKSAYLQLVLSHPSPTSPASSSTSSAP